MAYGQHLESMIELDCLQLESLKNSGVINPTIPNFKMLAEGEYPTPIVCGVALSEYRALVVTQHGSHGRDVGDFYHIYFLETDGVYRRHDELRSYIKGGTRVVPTRLGHDQPKVVLPQVNDLSTKSRDTLEAILGRKATDEVVAKLATTVFRHHDTDLYKVLCHEEFPTYLEMLHHLSGGGGYAEEATRFLKEFLR